MNAVIHEGGCLCGAVRYRCAGDPTGVEYCHCGMCRRSAGAPTVAWAAFPAGAMTFTRGQPTLYASSERGRRGFCNRCGGALTFQWSDHPELIDVTVGSLDDPAAVPPRWHIFDADRIPWLTLHDDLPRYPARRPKA